MDKGKKEFVIGEGLDQHLATDKPLYVITKSLYIYRVERSTDKCFMMKIGGKEYRIKKQDVLILGPSSKQIQAVRSFGINSANARNYFENQQEKDRAAFIAQLISGK